MTTRTGLGGKTEAEGMLADNIVYFARTLRRAGLRIGPAAVKDAIEAVLAAGIGTRADFYWTLHCVLVGRHEDRAVFDEAFRLFWRSRGLVEKMLALLSPVVADTREKDRSRAAQQRVSQALFGNESGKDRNETTEIEFDARFSLSAREVLRKKDFAQMSAAELADAREAIASMRIFLRPVPTRRSWANQRGQRLDPRAMMRQSLRTGGELVLPRFREPRRVQPPLVVLADISGSMSQYSRIFLHFLHAMVEHHARVHTFVFGTRLTNVTRQMRHRDPDEALSQAAAAVMDWSGGTRIGETLARFNRLWSRRVLGQGAVVLLITDGLERDDVHLLAKEMERLRKSCRRVIWLNPLLRFDGFEARARGVRTMLAHVDEFRPVHSLEALSDLAAALDGSGTQSCNPRHWLGLGKSAAA